MESGSDISGTVSLDTTLAGIARVTVTSGTQLSATAGLKTLVNLTAIVPNSAAYFSKQILDLSSVKLTSTSLTAIPVIDGDGIHVAAYLGDANGSQTYNSPDASAAQRIIVGTSTGLSAYPLADPFLIVDVTGNGAVQSDDVTYIQRTIVGTATAEIPTYPGLPLQSGGSSGADPIVSTSRDLQASVGETLQAPVRIEVTEPTGVALQSLDLAIAYDPAALEFTGAELGELLIGFGLNVNSATPGVLRLSLAGSEALSLPHSAFGELLLLEFRVLSGSGTSSPLNLLARSAGLETALYDDLGRPLTLSPAPTNESFDAVDGRVEILPDGWAQAVDAALATASFEIESEF